MKATTMRRARQLHHYLGVFFAPAILLFAVSGALQTFHLHERGAPPRWIVWLASIHKDQRLPPPGRSPDHDHHAADAGHALAAGSSDHDGVPGGDHGDHAGGADDAARHAHEPAAGTLRWFVAALAAALTLSTLLGVVVALDQRRTRGVTLLLLAAGTGVPLILLYG